MRLGSRVKISKSYQLVDSTPKIVGSLARIATCRISSGLGLGATCRESLVQVDLDLNTQALHNRRKLTVKYEDTLAGSCALDSLLLQARLSVLRSRAGEQHESEIGRLRAMVDSGRLVLFFTKEPGFRVII